MKRYKFLTYLFAGVLALNLTACSGKTDLSSTNVSTPTDAPTATPVSEKSLYAHGLDIISMMDEMIRSDFYLNTMSASPEIEEKASELAQGDYTKPIAVYELTVPEFADLLTLLDAKMEGYEDLSSELQTQLNNRSASAFITQLNAMEGVVAIATGSVFTANKLFVSHEITENTIYLYTFESGAPIAILYTIGENNAISAGGYFLLSESISTESAMELQNSLKDAHLFFTVTELETK